MDGSSGVQNAENVVDIIYVWSLMKDVSSIAIHLPNPLLPTLLAH